MLKSWMSAVCYTVLSLAVFNGGAAADEWDAKVDEIMANFTNVDVVGQMTQIAGYGLLNSTYQLDEEAVRGFAKYHVGSYLSPPMSDLGEIDGKWGWTTAEMRAFVAGIQKIAMEENGGHPMVYGTDSAHGNALVTDTVYFGQQINAAATFNPDLVYEQGRITARDTLASGIPWIFDPVLDIMHNPLWPREYATKAEYTVAVIGEEVYEEKTGDINDLTLPLGQIEYVKELASTGTKVILVLFEGRPRILNDLPENVYAVLNGMLSCEQGGKAVAEIIYGDVNPSGRMPITYPKDTGNVMIPYRHRVSTQCASGDYCEPQWIFGHGLSYTDFTYSDMNISTANVTSSSDSVNVSVTVTNSGSVAGKETVMLFLTQPYRSISVPEVKQLKKFSKISLEAGASQTVSFELTAADWSVYYPQIGQGLKLVAEDADYVVAIKPETDCDVYNETAAANPLCATFTLSTGEYPFGSLVAE
uniref:beta-glucosidase n=1 Tax=Phytophthora ramorum TaxID=164328 RepID=H3H822_PHYRM